MGVVSCEFMLLLTLNLSQSFCCRIDNYVNIKHPMKSKAAEDSNTSGQ